MSSPSNVNALQLAALMHGILTRCNKTIIVKNRSGITPDPGGHRSQCPCAQGRTRAKQDQAQASSPGQNQTRSVGGATTHGRRTRQAGERVPTETRSGAGGCTLQTAHLAGTLRQNPNTATSCAKETYGPGQLQGRAGTGQTQAVAATTGIRLVGNAASNTASAWSDPEHTRKRTSRRRVVTKE